MSWLDRVQGAIELTSPDGEIFSAKWTGNSRSVQKKLGIFTYPKFDGAVIQDLGLAGTRYPFRLHFDGPDNDLEATRFFDAFTARGPWQVQLGAGPDAGGMEVEGEGWKVEGVG